MNDNKPSFSDKKTEFEEPPRNVLFIVYPDIVLLDLSGPLQVFSHARRAPNEAEAYQVHIASHTGGKVNTNVPLGIETQPMSKWLCGENPPPIDTLIIIGGDGVYDAITNQKFVEDVHSLAKRSRRVCSACSGAILLAKAGLLDGRRAVTHWEDCDYLASQFPKVTVEVDPIYIKDSNIWTSAGITAGIDMALALVQEDLGSTAAINMARSLVTPMVRSGGQSQFSVALDQQSKDQEGQFAELHRWIANKLHLKLSVDDMADHCGMNPRNFSRRYSEAMGLPPAKSLQIMRVDAARDMLASTKYSIKSIAMKCGFHDDERMRRAFLRHLRTPPSAYRKQFQL